MARRALPLTNTAIKTRPGELRHMEWPEIDFDTATWQIPAGKMKTKNAHIVSLFLQAIERLKLDSAADRFRTLRLPKNENVLADENGGSTF